MPDRVHATSFLPTEHKIFAPVRATYRVGKNARNRVVSVLKFGDHMTGASASKNLCAVLKLLSNALAGLDALDGMGGIFGPTVKFLKVPQDLFKVCKVFTGGRDVLVFETLFKVGKGACDIVVAVGTSIKILDTVQLLSLARVAGALGMSVPVFNVVLSAFTVGGCAFSVGNSVWTLATRNIKDKTSLHHQFVKRKFWSDLAKAEKAILEAQEAIVRARDEGVDDSKQLGALAKAKAAKDTLIQKRLDKYNKAIKKEELKKAGRQVKKWKQRRRDLQGKSQTYKVCHAWTLWRTEREVTAWEKRCQNKKEANKAVNAQIEKLQAKLDVWHEIANNRDTESDAAIKLEKKFYNDKLKKWNIKCKITVGDNVKEIANIAMQILLIGVVTTTAIFLLVTPLAGGAGIAVTALVAVGGITASTIGVGMIVWDYFKWKKPAGVKWEGYPEEIETDVVPADAKPKKPHKKRKKGQVKDVDSDTAIGFEASGEKVKKKEKKKAKVGHVDNDAAGPVDASGDKGKKHRKKKTEPGIHLHRDKGTGAVGEPDDATELNDVMGTRWPSDDESDPT